MLETWVSMNEVRVSMRTNECMKHELRYKYVQPIWRKKKIVLVLYITEVYSGFITYRKIIWSRFGHLLLLIYLTQYTTVTSSV